MSRFYFYEPASGHGLAHDPFNAIVGPPVASHPAPGGRISHFGIDAAQDFI